MEFTESFEREQRIRNGNVENKQFVRGLVSDDIPEKNAVTMLYHIANHSDVSDDEFRILLEELENIIHKFCEKAYQDREEVNDLAKSIKTMIGQGSIVSGQGPTDSGYILFKDWM